MPCLAFYKGKGKFLLAYLLSSSLILISIFSGILKNRFRALSFVLLMTMWVLFWGSQGIADQAIYMFRYSRIGDLTLSVWDYEFGFRFLMKIASQAGLNYRQFLMVVSSLGLLLIVSTVKKLSPKPQIVYALYFIFPLMLDIVQVRYFLAMSIFIYALRFLIKPSPKNILNYVALIVVASLFHFTLLFFVGVIFFVFMKENILLRIILIVTIAGLFLSYTGFLSTAVDLLTFAIPFEMLETYFLRKVRFGFLEKFFVQISVILIMEFYYRYIKSRNSFDAYCNIVRNLNIISLILFPLYIYDVNFFRLFRILYIPNYIVISLAIDRSNTTKRFQLILLSIFLALSLFMYHIFLNSRESVFWPLFENNFVFNLLNF